MRIAFHSRNIKSALIEKNSGLISECALTIAKKYTEHEFIVFTDSICFKKNVPPNLTILNFTSTIKTTIAKKLWYDFKLPALIKKYKIDVLVNMDGICSLRLKTNQCLFIESLQFYHTPELFSNSSLRFLKKFTPLSLNKARTIITTSDAAKKDIHELYKIKEEEINVVTIGANEAFHAIEENKKNMVKEKYSEGKEFFLHIGSLNNTGNVIHLLKAFSLFKKRLKSNMQLFIIATTSLQSNPVIKEIETYRYRNDVKLIETPDENELALITAAAYAVIYPSYFDQSAILNAIKCQTAVITADTSISRELFGNAALFVNSSSPEDISGKMITLFNNENTRNELINAGRHLIIKYDWNKTAEQWWQAILKAKS